MSSQIVIPEQDLPNWMKRARQGFDWGILLVIGFSLLIAWSFIENPTLPQSNDNIHYAFQTYDAALALREGRLYPRWSPYALGGFGAPIPHYTPPAASYSTAVIEVLFTNDTILSMRIVYVLSFIIAGLAVYLLVMQRVNAMAGLIAALLYVYSPYFGLTVPHVLGDLPQMMALALIPLLLWTVDRLLQKHQFAILLVASVMAALLLTSLKHSVMGLGLTAILMIIHISEYGEWRQLGITVAAICLGIGMAAFYWFPAYAERGLVQWLPVANYAVQYQFTWSDLFARTQQLDSGMLRQIAVFNLGWTLLIMCGVAILSIAVRRGTYFQTIFLFFGVALCFIAIFTAPIETWLIGGVVLCLAIGGSTIGYWLYRTTRLLQNVTITGLLLVIIWLAAPIWLSLPSATPIEGVSLSDQMQYEAQSNTVALLPANAMYPTTLAEVAFALPSLSQESSSDNINRYSNTNQAQLTHLQSGTHYARYSVFTETPLVAHYNQAYFPGWRASVDNKPVPLQREGESGLTEIELSAVSNGTLTISLGTTLIRTIAWIITYFSLVIVVILAWRRLIKMPEAFDSSQLLSTAIVRFLALLVIFGIVARSTPMLRESIYSLREPANYRLQDKRLTNYATDGHLEYWGYEVPQNPVAVGDTISLSLFWHAIRSSDTLYEVNLQVRHIETNTVIYTSAKHPPGFYPTAFWINGLYIEDEYRIPFPNDAPAGEYAIEVNLWQCSPQCDTPVNFYIRNRQLLGTTVPIPITVQ